MVMLNYMPFHALPSKRKIIVAKMERGVWGKWKSKISRLRQGKMLLAQRDDRIKGVSNLFYMKLSLALHNLELVVIADEHIRVHVVRQHLPAHVKARSIAVLSPVRRHLAQLLGVG